MLHIVCTWISLGRQKASLKISSLNTVPQIDNYCKACSGVCWLL